MADYFGAGQKAWKHWSETLGLYEHLLPVVSNPNAHISPDSTIQTLGKTPSQYNFRREAIGFTKWTQHQATMREVGKWELEEDYGICVQARAIRAFDIDVPGKKRSARIVEAIQNCMGLRVSRWPKRYREGTGKILLPFRLTEPLTKRVLHVSGGIIEVLADGQQWIAEGTYINDGQADGRYKWRYGWPKTIDEVPLLTMEQFEEICGMLQQVFDIGLESKTGVEHGWKIARQRKARDREAGPMPGIEDPVVDWLLENWTTHDFEGSNGQIFIECPFEDEHTSITGPSSTAYFPAGTGGYERGHFKCLHAHCHDRTDAEFLAKMGCQRMKPEDFPELSPDESGDSQNRPVDLAKPARSKIQFMLNKQGLIEIREYNMAQFFMHPELCGKRIVWDDFSAKLAWCPPDDLRGEERWTEFADEHLVQLCETMDRFGFEKGAKPHTIRAAVYRAAMKNRVDLAIAWAERLPEWDGVPRVERFWSVYGAAEGKAYTRAVSRYTWTALAGRVLDPGCQVDMVPILIGEQGTRKTSLIAAIAPTRDWFTDINLMQRDDDTSRKMRGKVVVELDELRGLQGRAVEDVKSFITRREEEWVPKYQEFTKTFKRRFVMLGSTNRDDFLGDPTGERRYLPLEVGIGRKLDVEHLVADRDQLWAEAIAMWRQSGIDWREAEDLAVAEHVKYKSTDPWAPLVINWLCDYQAMPLSFESAPIDNPYAWSTEDVLLGAGLVDKKRLEKRDQMRMGRLLKALGAKKKHTSKGATYAISREQLVLNGFEITDDPLLD